MNGLCVAIFDLGQAYRRFFKYHGIGSPIPEHPDVKFSQKKIEHYIRIGKTITFYDMVAHPKFKVKRYAAAVWAMQNDKLNFYGESKGVSISGVGKVKYRTQNNERRSLRLPEGNKQGKFYNPRVSYTKNGKWVLTLAFDVKEYSKNSAEPNINSANFKLNDYGMGIDLGVKVTADVSCNGKHIVYKNVNKSRRMKKLEKRKNVCNATQAGKLKIQKVISEHMKK